MTQMMSLSANVVDVVVGGDKRDVFVSHRKSLEKINLDPKNNRFAFSPRDIRFLRNT